MSTTSVPSGTLPTRPSLSGSISAGADIKDRIYKNKSSLKNSNDIYAETAGEIGKTFNGPGGRPRGLIDNIGAGLSKGLEAGFKLNSAAEKKGDFDKYADEMEYLQEANNAALERSEWYEKREAARTEFLPQVVAYADNIDRLDPQSQRIMAQSILEGYGRAVGEDFKLSSIDGSNPFLMTIESSKGHQLFDVRSMFAGDQVMQQSLAMKMPEYQMKLQQERQDKEREFAIKEESNRVKSLKYAAPDEGDNPYGSIPIKILGGKGMTPFMQTINAEINLAKDVPVILHQIDEAKNIIKSNPSLGKAFNNWAGKGSFSKGWMDDKTRDAYEKVDKISSRIAEAYIKAKGGAISEGEREIIKAGLFKVDNLGSSNQYNIDSVAKELKISKSRGDFASQELKAGRIATAGSFDEYQKSTQSPERTPEQVPKDLVTIFDPVTMKEEVIDATKVDAAIQGGWELKQ